MMIERFTCQGDRLRLVRRDDGDVVVALVSREGRDLGSVSFCTLMGGGRSPETLKALRALYAAVEADNARDGNPRPPGA